MSTPRRRFIKDFKLEAVKMVNEGGFSKTKVGRRLGVCSATIGRRDAKASGNLRLRLLLLKGHLYGPLLKLCCVLLINSRHGHPPNK